MPVASAAEATDENAIKKVIYDYFDAFNRNDIDAVMTFVHAPLVLTAGPQSTVYNTPDQVREFYAKFRENAAKKGFAKSEWVDFEVKLLGPDYAIAGGTYVNYKADGSEIRRVGGGYRLQKVDCVWKIILASASPPPDSSSPARKSDPYIR
jgi:ketosteroid isomerase-like protein